MTWGKLSDVMYNADIDKGNLVSQVRTPGARYHIPTEAQILNDKVIHTLYFMIFEISLIKNVLWWGKRL